LIGPALGEQIDLYLGLFLGEQLLDLIIYNWCGEGDALVEGGFLLAGTVTGGFCRVLTIIGFPLDVKEAGKFDACGDLFDVGLKGHIVDFALDLGVHLRSIA
jgi:hypothetical protein